MSAEGPILILEDDEDDREILEMIFIRMKENCKRRYFAGSEAFLEYLKTTQAKPLLILSDINMVRADGLTLKRQIEENPVLKGKTIPYVFMTTSANPPDVIAAYNLFSQGFFVKAIDFDSMFATLSCIISYWKMSLHPNNI